MSGLPRPASLKELERLATKAENEATRLGAMLEILDRGYGKPGQQVSLDVTHYDHMDEHQLREVVEEQLRTIQLLDHALGNTER